MYEYINTNISIIIWSWNDMCISLVHITPSHHSTTVANQIYQTNYRTRRKVCCYCSNKKSEHDTAWGDEVLQNAEGGMGHTICQSVVSICPSLTCRHNNISWCIHLNKGKRCWRHDVSEIKNRRISSLHNEKQYAPIWFSTSIKGPLYTKRMMLWYL